MPNVLIAQSETYGYDRCNVSDPALSHRVGQAVIRWVNDMGIKIGDQKPGVIFTQEPAGCRIAPPLPYDLAVDLADHMSHDFEVKIANPPKVSPSVPTQASGIAAEQRWQPAAESRVA